MPMAAEDRRRHVRTRVLLVIALAVALVCVVSALALGLANRQATASSAAAAQTSRSFSGWVKVVDLGGSLNGWSRGRSVVAIAVNGGDGVRFVVTLGAAPGWGAKVARFRYWVWPETDSPVPPPQQIPLGATVIAHGDWKTYDLRSLTSLPPGTYRLLYNGAGWYQMAVYVSTKT